MRSTPRRRASAWHALCRAGCSAARRRVKVNPNTKLWGAGWFQHAAVKTRMTATWQGVRVGVPAGSHVTGHCLAGRGKYGQPLACIPRAGVNAKLAHTDRADRTPSFVFDNTLPSLISAPSLRSISRAASSHTTDQGSHLPKPGPRVNLRSR